jgi:hypothetical protein
VAAEGRHHPRLSDAELLVLAVMQALLGYTSEARWLRHAGKALRHLFPTCRTSPATTSGCEQRCRRSSTSSAHWHRTPPFWTDALWIADPTPVECGRSRPTAKRSALAGWAGYGCSASHSRHFWGQRLHMVCTV